MLVEDGNNNYNANDNSGGAYNNYNVNDNSGGAFIIM